jgi:hypothetical protein
MDMDMGIIQGDIRRNKRCSPVPAPVVPCPIAINTDDGSSPAWISVVHCHTCEHLRRLVIEKRAVSVDCKAIEG